MPFEILALPVIISFIVGFINGLNKIKSEESEES